MCDRLQSPYAEMGGAQSLWLTATTTDAVSSTQVAQDGQDQPGNS